MCDAGYSPASATDSTCLRQCPLGPDPANPLFYETGPVCWPYCYQGESSTHPFGVDEGPACRKVIHARPGGTDVPVCAPKYLPQLTQYTAYDVYTDADDNTVANRILQYEPGWSPTYTLKMCYENCPPVCTGPNTPAGCTSVQLIQNEFGQCNLPCNSYITYGQPSQQSPPGSGPDVPNSRLNCDTSQCNVNEGEWYLGSGAIYPSVSNLFYKNPNYPIPNSPPVFPTNAYGYINNYNQTPNTTGIPTNTWISYGTCIRDPYSFLAATRVSTPNPNPSPPVGPYYAATTIKPNKIIRDFTYPICQNGQQFSFFSDGGPMFVGSDPLQFVSSSYTVDGFNSTYTANNPDRTLTNPPTTNPQSSTNGYLPTPDKFRGFTLDGSEDNFQNLFNCEDICTNPLYPVREGSYCMQSPGSLNITASDGKVYKDYSIKEYAITFGGQFLVNSLSGVISPQNDVQNRRVINAMSDPNMYASANYPTLGFNTTKLIPWTGNMRPAGTSAPSGTTCTGGKVLARRWIAGVYPGLYTVDSSAPGYSTPGTYTCIDPSVCAIGTTPLNPIGFREIPSGLGTGDMEVFCSFYGTNGFADTCSARNMQDDAYTNYCYRGYEFRDPNQKLPNVCPVIPDVNYRNFPATFTSFQSRQTVLYGNSATIPDAVQPQAPGYKGEETVAGQDYRVTQCTGLFDPLRAASPNGVYGYDDIVASFVQTDPVTNEQLFYGPFFRCLQEAPGANGPPSPVTNSGFLYSNPAVEGNLTNAYWTNQNVPTVWKNDAMRHAGHGGNLNSLCVNFTGGGQFCPNVCVTQCPVGNAQNVGLYEPAYTYDSIAGTVSESSCWPRCGPSDIYQGNNEVCTLKAYGKDKYPAWSLCDDNGKSVPVVQLNDTAADSNGNSSATATKFSVRTGKCYSDCPEFTQLAPVDHGDLAASPVVYPPRTNYTLCIDTCPESESFYDTPDKCMKIAAQRAERTPPSVTESFTDVLTTNVSTSHKISKFAMYGGAKALWVNVGIIVGIGVFTALILLAKRRQVVKSTQFFRA